MNADRLKYLFSLALQGNISEEERDELKLGLRQEETAATTNDLIEQAFYEEQADILLPDTSSAEILSSIFHADKQQILNSSATVHRIPSLKERIHFPGSSWFKYAAAILIILSACAYLYITNTKEKPVSPAVVLSKADIQPGGNKAILTLSDGSTINLDSAANGQLATQGAASIVKSQNGLLEYQSDGSHPLPGGMPADQAGASSRSEEGVGDRMNTLSTPRGGQYQVVLPDGTKAWLNAASSITYPTTFANSTREVTVSGEAYFDVAKKVHQPFVVKTSNDIITVLGTSFNINAYPDEPIAKTSLLAGAVKVNDQLLSPGQAYAGGKVSQTIIEQDLAWKNGSFNFNNLSVAQIMRQLSRWYSIDIIYAHGIPEADFVGEMSKSIPLSEIISFLKNSGIACHLNDRKQLVVE